MVDVSATYDASFSYTISDLNPPSDRVPNVYLNTLNGITLGYQVDGASTGYNVLQKYPGISEDYDLGRLFWDGKTSTLFEFRRETAEEYQFSVFTIGGAELPEIKDARDLAAFDELITGEGRVPTGDPLAPDVEIDFAGIPGVSISEDDRFSLSIYPYVDGGVGDDEFYYSGGLAIVEGGEGRDTLIIMSWDSSDVEQFALVAGGVSMGFFDRQFNHVTARGIETFQFGREGSASVIETFTFDEIRILASADPLILRGTNAAEQLSGDAGDDRLVALAGDDTLEGGDGRDTLNGGAGDDRITGGATSDDLRDVVYAGAGADYADGGHGNDRIHGMDGNDTLLGGFGADVLVGQEGDDVLSGGPLSDEVSGGPGDDFLNGGFGFDRLKGGSGADKFFHVGLASHGRDWVKDYSAAEGDVLLFGGDRAATGDDFLIQLANTTWAGAADVAEAFITHIPTGTRLWSLIDGAAEDYITIQVAGGSAYDLTI